MYLHFHQLLFNGLKGVHQLRIGTLPVRSCQEVFYKHLGWLVGSTLIKTDDPCQNNISETSPVHTCDVFLKGFASVLDLFLHVILKM